MNVERHSPSSCNLFCAAPALFVLERVLNRRQPVGVPAHRGTAIEAGVAAGLLDPTKPVEECVEIAEKRYRSLTALSPDPRRALYGADIAGMVRTALEELRPYGVPTSTQGYVEWRPEGLKAPIVGFYDFAWEDKGILVDLKTTERLPSSIKPGHARQAALYAAAISDNIDPRLTYVTPKKRATYRLENVWAHRQGLHKIALAVERFLALSDDPEFFVSITAPDCDSFYWNAPEARQSAFEVWGF